MTPESVASVGSCFTEAARLALAGAGKGRLQASVQRRYYLCSMKEPARIAQAIREHWHIENQPHWTRSCSVNSRRNQHSAIALI